MTIEREIRNAGHPADDGKCSSCRHDSFVIREARNASGNVIYPYVCRRCDHVLQQYARKRDAQAYANRFGPLRRVQTSAEKKLAQGRIQLSEPTPCEVCGSTKRIEEHHWAPWHLFGEEAEKWPTSLLCQKCHVRWHQTVTPNMSEPKT